MSTVGPTCSPNSFQLRLAFNCRRPSISLVRLVRFHKLDRRFRLVSSLSGDYNAGSDRRPVKNSWTNVNSSTESFSGWSGDNGEESSKDVQQNKRRFGGIIGAGAAAVVLVVGISFAALSLSKRNTKGLKVETLTAQEELSLTSDSHNGSTDDNLNEDNGVKDESTLEGTTGKDDDYSSFEVNNEPVSEDRQSDGDLDHTVSGDDATKRNSIPEDTESEPSVGVTPDESPEATQLISFGDNPVAETTASLAELTEEISPSSTSDVSENISTTDNKGVSVQDKTDESDLLFGSLPSTNDDIASESITLDTSENIPLGEENFDLSTDQVLVAENIDLTTDQVLVAENNFPREEHNFNGAGLSGYSSVSAVTDVLEPNKQEANIYSSNSGSKSISESVKSGKSFSSAGIPAPSVVSAALQVVPGKVLVPAVVDHVQGQALAALQVLKVVEADAQPGDLCTRREYARWLVSASSALSRSTVSKVYPAMYIENVTELAFDDVTPEDPDFSSIQGLAEAGLISSKLSRQDLSSSLEDDESSLFFSPQSPLSRQDLVSWKMALEKRLLPETDKKLSGFIDINKINPDAWPAIAADVAAGEQGIIALAFGYTRLFHPDKPLTKAQAAIALATGEASEIVNEELARIEAEALAENAVTVHNALVAEVERDVNATFEKELLLERQKIDALDKMAEEARLELERLRAEREADKINLMKERIAVESEMEVLSRLRHEMEEQLEGLLSNKVEISYEKERIDKLRKVAEFENEEIARLQHDLEVERKALSLARSWAEDEAKRARTQAKILEEARDRWERHGIKVVVDDDLREEENVGVTWDNTAKQLSVEGTVSRAESIVDKLKAMAESVREKSKATILSIIQKMQSFIISLKEWGKELKHSGLSKMNGSLQELQQKSTEYTSAVQEGAKRIGGECRESIEKLTQKFRT
ncbi:uncharacterized protein LOC124937541 isoform X2 [Impatiens glandulifera]|uniref:uncharacterized protein LOC124937541 isoform X2 n=1 Tax=Impatiens glandulifera TaxID=253017 RepID=UPI001FB106F7|nr:uncharacterized protein LOC124937541 isoform X2 [Impatiens glandulifera]